MHAFTQVGVKQVKFVKHLDERFRRRLQRRLGLLIGSERLAGPVMYIVIVMHYVSQSRHVTQCSIVCSSTETTKSQIMVDVGS
jgi:hypothetical protein